jgi:hypothetical protein
MLHVSGPQESPGTGIPASVARADHPASCFGTTVTSTPAYAGFEPNWLL